jgi:o-succinylbenzoate synthase
LGEAAFLCGLDTALLDILSQAEGKPLAEWLAGGPVAKSVPVNATIGAPDNEKAVALAQKAISEGFECIKLKIGMAATISGELERVQAVRTAIGKTARLRLDANGAWTTAQAINTLRELEPLGIELVEQPVAAHDLAGMALVRKSINIPIAADEAVTDIASAQAVIAAGAADILVIKPMMVGGLRTGLELIKMAQLAGLGAFVTTTIDSGVGIAAALHLAATLPEPVLACGLATASLLQDTLVQDLPIIRQGRMFLPNKPGLGVSYKL